MALLELENLSVDFTLRTGTFRAVDNLSYSLNEGEVLCIVGESGSGKSVSSMAMMGLLDKIGTVSAKKININGHDMLNISPAERTKLMGNTVSMIFQDSTTSLNPSFSIGWQLDEMLKTHTNLNKKERYNRSVELLEQVGIPDPKKRLNDYPHQLSGGMNQRVMIAIAISCNPKLLIADEPVTALDVTVQAQIIDLLLSIQQKTKMSLILITHDLSIAAEIAEKTLVMYAGLAVEFNNTKDLFKNPKHPYTKALIDSTPESSRGAKRLNTIPGFVPNRYNKPSGCLFNPRCNFATDKCRTVAPDWLKNSAQSMLRCHYPLGKKGETNE